MKLSQAVAGGSRNVDATRVFLPLPANSAEASEASAHVPTSAQGWKWDLHLRIWSGKGPKGHPARSVLTVLLWNSDGTGRTWLGLPAIMEKAGMGSERTVRRALDVLANGGWLKVTPQTWASLTAEQAAVGRALPRRGDLGQAPNVYTVLDRPRRQVTPDLPTRPGLTRTQGSPVEETPLHICRGGQEQIREGGPDAHLPPDPNPSGSESRMESERDAAPAPTTHHFSEAQRGEWGWLEAWKLLVESHAQKTKAIYGVAPLAPDLKRDDRRAVAECFEGVAVDVAAKLRDRGVTRELDQVKQDLAVRVMALYFKRDNEHLRRVKHALRDLPREFHARITEAMQAILRESHDAANVPRRTPVLEPPAQEKKAENADNSTKIEATEKPLPAQTTSAFARNVLEMLGTATTKDDDSAQRSKTSEPAPSKPVLPDWLVVEMEQEHARKAVQKPAQERSEASSRVQRSNGRVGAPRWGALPPTPTRVRRVSRLQLPEPEQTPEGVEPHPRE